MEDQERGASTGSTIDIYKKYNITGKKLSQQEIDLIVARYRKKRED